ncbi:hypothetical protein [Spiroplasma floricola]|uniref:Uncharacterized protein n=1 Tax=Spiroplasma floricola 23-6 TaxID=1336749 RepID=A0A2K8SD13_9MOLU|nr:hypothetical protein [Spiroplasma floricola]AUB31351.1 hypothetical protein SFLOR_v1c02940 [Spiroplasma floricola 23-6]
MNLLAALENNNLLVLSVVLLLIIPLASISSWYITIKFQKSKSEVKFANKILVSTMLSFQIISILTSILVLLSYLGVLVSNDASLSQTLTIVFIVLSVVLSAAWFIMVIFFSNQIWFYIETEEGKLITLGETIRLSKVTKIIEDDEKSAVYINYLEGKRNLKKLKFSKKTTIGMYFLENVEKMGFALEKGTEITYFKEEIAKIRALALENSAKETSKKENSNEIKESDQKQDSNQIKESTKTKKVSKIKEAKNDDNDISKEEK